MRKFKEGDVVIVTENYVSYKYDIKGKIGVISCVYNSGSMWDYTIKLNVPLNQLDKYNIYGIKEYQLQLDTPFARILYE